MSFTIVMASAFALSLFTALCFMSYGIYQRRSEIPQAAISIVSDMKNEYGQWQLQRQLAKEEAVKQAQWENSHPEEVRKQKEYAAREGWEELSRTWRDFKILFCGLAFLVGATVASVLFILFIVGAGMFIKFICASIKNKKAWQNFCLLWNDGRELVFGMYKAVKEHVCPFQTVVDDDNFFERFGNKFADKKE